MSGQLVGEVISAADDLRERGLSGNAFHALVVIAEGCRFDTRQGAVPWSRIQAGIFGGRKDDREGSVPLPAKRTAQRALEELTGMKLVRVVKPGFKNQHGVSRAPIYEMEPLVDADTQVSSSNPVDRDTQVSSSSNVDDDTKQGGSRQLEGGSRHSGVVLPGSITGSLPGARTNAPCTGSGCSVCAIIRREIDLCTECDSNGRLADGPDGAPGSRCRDHWWFGHDGGHVIKRRTEGGWR